MLSTPSPREPPPSTAGGEQPAQVAVGEDPPVDRADRAVGAGAASVVERSRTNARMAIATTIAATPSIATDARHPSEAIASAAVAPDDDRADVAARDVGGDRGPDPARRELLGEQRVADRVLRRAADPRDDVRDGEPGERRPRSPGPPSRRRSAARRRRAASGRPK